MRYLKIVISHSATLLKGGKRAVGRGDVWGREHLVAPGRVIGGVGRSATSLLGRVDRDVNLSILN